MSNPSPEQQLVAQLRILQREQAAATIEQVAIWLEQCATGNRTTNRQHADQLRTGSWLTDGTHTSAETIADIRAADNDS